MVSTGIRNNNKAFPNQYFGYFQKSDGTSGSYLCYLCRTIYDSPSSGWDNFKTHILADHGFTDAG